MNKILIFIILFWIYSIQCRVILYPDTEAPKYCNDNRDIDVSDLKVLQLNDTHFFLNGSVTTKIDFDAPVEVYLFSERAIRGQWLPGEVSVSFKKFCDEMHNENRGWGELFKDFPPCPISAGSILKLDMFIIDISRYSIPTTFVGRWHWIIKAKRTKKRLTSFCVQFDGSFVNA